MAESIWNTFKCFVREYPRRENTDLALINSQGPNVKVEAVPSIVTTFYVQRYLARTPSRDRDTIVLARNRLVLSRRVNGQLLPLSPADENAMLNHEGFLQKHFLFWVQRMEGKFNLDEGRQSIEHDQMNIVISLVYSDLPIFNPPNTHLRIRHWNQLVMLMHAVPFSLMSTHPMGIDGRDNLVLYDLIPSIYKEPEEELDHYITKTKPTIADSHLLTVMSNHQEIWKATQADLEARTRQLISMLSFQ